jgi:hypothetical protein
LIALSSTAKLSFLHQRWIFVTPYSQALPVTNSKFSARNKQSALLVGTVDIQRNANEGFGRINFEYTEIN